MITTTLQKLRKAGACYDGYNRLVRAIQGKELTDDDGRESYIRFAHKDDISIIFILDSNGFDNALWALRACDQTPDLVRKERLFAVWCARQVQHLMSDDRGIAALDVAERHADGLATDSELAAARDAARDATWDAAMDATWDATWAATWAAANDAASDAAWAAARAAARAAASDAVWDAARAAQKEKFIEMFC